MIAMSAQTELGIHPMADGRGKFSQLQEGEHYEVLMYSMRGDLHVPTVISWSNGETNDLDKDDLEDVKENAEEVLH